MSNLKANSTSKSPRQKSRSSQSKKSTSLSTKDIFSPRASALSLEEEYLVARIPITEVSSIEDGLWAAKAVVGESFPVRATVFREGHDAYSAEAVLLTKQGREVQRVLMKDIALGLDRYEAWLSAPKTGQWYYRVESWSDPYRTWTHNAAAKIAAQVDEELVLEEGALLFERAILGEAIDNPRQTAPKMAERKILAQAIKTLRNQDLSFQERLSVGLHSSVRQVFRQHPLRDLLGHSRSYPLWVDRPLALYGSWYEIFPRSLGAYQDRNGNWVSGTLKTAMEGLPRIANMGFDVIYLTPIHPIGTTFRKGRNNALVAAPGDPGSPYGIGNTTGGHQDIHPDLGTIEDFHTFVAKARDLGMEVALDIALQCSPDHPWVQEHPEWFNLRPDGSIAYAENPPKKYQDIYPLNFDNDPEGLYQEIQAMLEYWVDQGVTLFRVDNPHTKPLAFWQRLLTYFRKHHPEVIFLAEAFTRPAMMRTLAQLGFHQSYTYFTWRSDKNELEDYFLELAKDSSPYMRPNLWPTTHDILTKEMVEGGEAAFALRAVLAAMASPSWGIYSGYELVENVQRPGFEEQIDNEKYQYVSRDYNAEKAQGITKLLRALNRIRRQHPALQYLRNLEVHSTTSPNLICFSKYLPPKSAGEAPDAIIVVVNLDPHNTTCGEVKLDFNKFPFTAHSDGRPCLEVTDELDGSVYQWREQNYVELNPLQRTAHIFSVKQI